MDKLAARFWAKVARRPSGCWEWAAATAPEQWGDPYGVFMMKRPEDRARTGEPKAAMAHRVAFALTKGRIPHGAQVLHQCDNRRCVRPSHLFLGSHADNMADMTQKGRAAKNASAAKLSAKDADLIRRVAGRVSVQALAWRFGVTPQTIRNVQVGRTWRSGVAPSRRSEPLVDGAGAPEGNEPTS